jgi:primary-amine oxidase
MGGQVRQVILGYDCPYHATLLDATVHESGSTTRKNAICEFERESGRPISRHTGGKGEMGAVKGFELVVRSISTVGNYDYIVSSESNQTPHTQEDELIYNLSFLILS